MEHTIFPAGTPIGVRDRNGVPMRVGDHAEICDLLEGRMVAEIYFDAAVCGFRGYYHSPRTGCWNRLIPHATWRVLRPEGDLYERETDL